MHISSLNRDFIFDEARKENKRKEHKRSERSLQEESLVPKEMEPGTFTLLDADRPRYVVCLGHSVLFGIVDSTSPIGFLLNVGECSARRMLAIQKFFEAMIVSEPHAIRAHVVAYKGNPDHNVVIERIKEMCQLHLSDPLLEITRTTNRSTHLEVDVGTGMINIYSPPDKSVEQPKDPEEQSALVDKDMDKEEWVDCTLPVGSDQSVESGYPEIFSKCSIS